MTPVTPQPSLSLRETAEALGISVRTLQRRKELLLRVGATRNESGWNIPPSALEALRDDIKMSGGDAPVSPPDITPVAPMSPPTSDTQEHLAESKELTKYLHEAQQRAAVAEARNELLERERKDLITRAEAAEATAREATAAAAALALTMKQLEHRPSRAVVDIPVSEDFSQDELTQSKEEKTSPAPPVKHPRGKLWKRAEKIFGTQR